MPDTGNPQDYYFAVDYSINYDPSDPDTLELSLFLCPKDFYDQNGHGICEHLAWEHPDFEQMEEASYTYCENNFTNPQDLFDWCIKEGFVFNETFASMSEWYSSRPGANALVNIPPPIKDWSKHTKCLTLAAPPLSQAVTPIKCSGKKFETAELTNLLVNHFSKNGLQEIFGSFDDGKESNPKNWKRATKKKFKLKDFNDALDGFQSTYEMEIHYDGEGDCSIILNESYINNTNNVVVARVFNLKDYEDCEVMFVTDEKDQEIVAVFYHID